MNDDGLKLLFTNFGTVTSASVAKDADGKCKGFGFACFASPDEATKAVTEMHLKVIKGKPLYVGLAEKREARAERLRQRMNPAESGKGGGKGAPMKGGPQQMYGQGAAPMPGKGAQPMMGMYPPQMPRPGMMMGPR